MERPVLNIRKSRAFHLFEMENERFSVRNRDSEAEPEA